MGLPGLEPGHEETGRNVVILVCVLLPEMLPIASRAGLGAEPIAPALSDDVTEAEKSPTQSEDNVGKKLWYVLSSLRGPKDQANWNNLATVMTGLKPI